MHFGYGGFGMTLLWIALIAVIILIVRALTNSYDKTDSKSENALDLLNRRYATGEITRNKYEVMKRDLLER